jgi:hypothetical protein
MPWEETDDYIRSGHGNAEDIETCRTIDISEPKGLKAIYCKSKSTGKWAIQSYLFSKKEGWTMEKAKEWFAAHRQSFEQSFTWVPTDKLEAVRTVGRIYLVRSPHIGRTLCMDSSGNVHEVTLAAEELKAAARTAIDKGWNLNHGCPVDATTFDAEFEEDAVECCVLCRDEEINRLFDEGKIHHVSPEWNPRSVDMVDGIAPKGLVLSGYAFLTDDQVPGDGLSTIEIYQMLPNHLGDRETSLVSKAYLQSLRGTNQQDLSDKWILDRLKALDDRIDQLSLSLNSLWERLYEKHLMTTDDKLPSIISLLDKIEKTIHPETQEIVVQVKADTAQAKKELGELKQVVDGLIKAFSDVRTQLKSEAMAEFKQFLKVGQVAGQFQDPIIGLNPLDAFLPNQKPREPKKLTSDELWRIAEAAKAHDEKKLREILGS